MADKITEQLKALTELPYGVAGEYIRREIDPLWGIDPNGDKQFTVKIEVNCTTSVTFTAEIEVTATDEAAAEKLVNAMVNAKKPPKLELDWDSDNFNFSHPFEDDWDDEDWRYDVKLAKP